MQLRTTCFVLWMVFLAASAKAEVIYTEANADASADWGNKSSSFASSTHLYESTAATANTGLASVLGSSDMSWSGTDGLASTSASTVSRKTFTFRVRSDGYIAFDAHADGQMSVSLHSRSLSPGAVAVSYTGNISGAYGDLFSGSMSRLPAYECDDTTLVDITQPYNFGGGSFSAGSLVEATLELYTSAQSGGGWGYGSYALSTIELGAENFTNLDLVPEPTSFSLLVVGACSASFWCAWRRRRATPGQTG